MKTKYTMKEVCAWSVTDQAKAKGTVEHRYVEVSCDTHPSRNPQVIELPTHEAIHLCASMASPAVVFWLLSTVKLGATIPSMGGITLPMIAQCLSSMEDLRELGLPTDLKLDINLDSGQFDVLDHSGKRATDLFVTALMRKAKNEI